MATEVNRLAAADAIDGARALLIRIGSQAGIRVVALGGLAIGMRCPSSLSPTLLRSYHDLDLYIRREDANPLAAALAEEGYLPAVRFNALHGRSRLMFDGDALHIDVLVDEFAMCHRLDLTERMDIDRRTLYLADLLLTKLQIARVTAKDVSDIAALLLDHALTDDDSGINRQYVARILARTWGWWRTATETLSTFQMELPQLGLTAGQRMRIVERSEGLMESARSAHKGARWRLRARVGDRLPWREEPEEV